MMSRRDVAAVRLTRDVNQKLVTLFTQRIFARIAVRFTGVSVIERKLETIGEAADEFRVLIRFGSSQPVVEMCHRKQTVKLEFFLLAR